MFDEFQELARIERRGEVGGPTGWTVRGVDLGMMNFRPFNSGYNSGKMITP